METFEIESDGLKVDVSSASSAERLCRGLVAWGPLDLEDLEPDDDDDDDDPRELYAESLSRESWKDQRCCLDAPLLK